MKNKTTMKTPKTTILPVLAIRDVVVFPHTRAPIFMGREKSIAASEIARKDYDNKVMLVTQKNPKVDFPEQADLMEVGTLGDIEQLLRLPDGTVKALVAGIDRYRIKKVFEQSGALFAEAELIEAQTLSADEISAYRRSLLKVWKEVGEVDNTYAELYSKSRNVRNLDELIGILGSTSKFSSAEKVALLSEVDWNTRIMKLVELLDHEVQLRNIQQRIDNRVKHQMEKNQRDYYLNEQIKAIRKELGAEDNNETDDIEELKVRIDKASLPAEADKAARAELKRLRQMPPMSSEATVVRNYLETLLDVPWTKKSRISKDLAKAKEVLDADHSGLEKVKERILEYLAVQKRVGKMKSPILCLVGAPGVGKTSLGESIARATGRKYVRVALGGVHDESEIRGHRRTYVGSMPGQIIKGMIRAGVKNPLFLLDEIDKMGMDFRGDPSSALLEVLDPEQNNTFQDHYLELTYDLSDVMFVATSNSYNIPGPLLDRMEVISLSGYTEEEKLHIARQHLVPKQLKATGLNTTEVDLTDDAILSIVRYYTREAGVRGLERAIGKIFRKIVLSSENTNATKTGKGKKAIKKVIRVDEKNLHDYLGIARYSIGLAAKEPRVGVVNGLAWTEVGGDLLSIEAQVFPGKGNIQRTGSLGDVMKESVEAARSVVRSRAQQLGIDAEKFYTTDLHVHFPDGATPKDGPSAGAATTTAIISAMTGIPVKSDVAMTGEINLHGEVLEIGGLKEKLLAAVRAGCTTVLIPVPNERDLEELPESAKKALRIVPVKTIDDVLKEALVRQPEPLKVSDEEPTKRRAKTTKKTTKSTGATTTMPPAKEKPAESAQVGV